MKAIIIREANKKDLNDILRLNLILFKKEFKEFDKTLNISWTYSQRGKDYFNKRITSKEGFVAVAINNKEVVGYICCGLHDNRTRIAKKAELENMMVTASADNSSGIRFYKKLGFTNYDLTLEKKLI